MPDNDTPDATNRSKDAGYTVIFSYRSKTRGKVTCDDIPFGFGYRQTNGRYKFDTREELHKAIDLALDTFPSRNYYLNVIT